MAEVLVEGSLEVGLGPGEFDNAISVAFEVGRWIETAVEEHLPASLIAAVALAAVERVFDRAMDESELAVNLEGCAGRPRDDRVLIPFAHAHRNGGLVVAHHTERHVMVAGAHGTGFEQAADAVEHASLPAPCVARMWV